MKHEMTYRVPYADTDQMGVVYYANYLEYFERSRTEMLRDAGLPYSKMETEGFLLPVSEVHCKYSASAHYDELLTFRSWVKQMKGVRVTIVSEVWCDETLLVRGEVTLACVNLERRAVRLPKIFTDCCLKYMEGENE